MSRNEYLGFGYARLRCAMCGEETAILEPGELEQMGTSLGELDDLCMECAARTGQDVDDNFFYAKPGEVIAFLDYEDVYLTPDYETNTGSTTLIVKEQKIIAIRITDGIPF